MTDEQEQINKFEQRLGILEGRYQQHTHNGLNSFQIKASDIIGSVGSSVAFWQPNNNIGASIKAYYNSTQAIDTIEADVQIPIPLSGTVSNLYIKTTDSQPASGDLVMTFRINGANTTLSVTIPATSPAGIYSNTSSVVTITAGDLIDMQMDNKATANSATVTNTIFQIN